MDAYCFKCKVKREIKDAQAVRLKNGRNATSGLCSNCDTKVFRMAKSSS